MRSQGPFAKLRWRICPQPFATSRRENGAEVVPRPENAWPVTLPGFKVELFASGLDNPRLMRTAPNGDIFLAEMHAGQIRVFRGVTSDGKAEQSAIFASGLHNPYGIAFYPRRAESGVDLRRQRDELARFPYHSGDLKASGPPQHVADLPGDGHNTRAVNFSPDGKKLFVGVGSGSNVRRSRYSSRGEESRRHSVV